MLIRTPEQDIERILFTEKTIAARVEQLAGELTAKYGDQAAPCSSACSRAPRFSTSISAAA